MLEKYLFCLLFLTYYFTNSITYLTNAEAFKIHTTGSLPPMSIGRVWHGYGKTRGFSQMGSAGTGTVVDFCTPWHTTYPYRGIMGMHG